ncbi:hypothetical protein AGOR_G00096250 [Albula goreensis]|uniref:Uncharacterized protein n=1 Tax=Albula goreensis TaxID=1534307 RepID=A0A8T3DJE9_9TELE|nr:hypothetical protein AGOR_G00096250 [Albula goreensis]
MKDCIYHHAKVTSIPYFPSGGITNFSRGFCVLHFVSSGFLHHFAPSEVSSPQPLYSVSRTRIVSVRAFPARIVPRASRWEISEAECTLNLQHPGSGKYRRVWSNTTDRCSGLWRQHQRRKFWGGGSAAASPHGCGCAGWGPLGCPECGRVIPACPAAGHSCPPHKIVQHHFVTRRVYRHTYQGTSNNRHSPERQN